VGRNDNPFDPIGEKKYDSIDARLQYKLKSIFAAAGYRQAYNNNSTSLTAYSSHSRNYFGNFSWTPRVWLALDAGYSKLHLDTAAGLAFFAGAPFAALQTGESLYISNIHAADFGARIALRKRADLYLGYNITLDAGDGRSSLLPPGTVGALLYNVQSFPLSFQTPLVRLSIPITPKLKWNAGYQYYGYHEEFGLYSVIENYHAHTGYTSLLWAF
jgi:predicted porin